MKKGATIAQFLQKALEVDHYFNLSFPNWIHSCNSRFSERSLPSFGRRRWRT